MNLNASRETVQAVAEALKYAAFLDDRIGAPDQARIAAWSEQVERHQLGRADLLDGLQKFYDNPHDRAIGVGDLITNARAARRDRTEREEESDRREREALRDRKAEDETLAVAMAFTSGPVPPTDRLEAAREALQVCQGKAECMIAIREFFAAKREAQKAVAR